MAEFRTFETGATRDADTTKPEYDGFNSPLVEKRFGEYMHLNRVQKDGSIRSSSNWKKGIPKDAYMHSLHRHFIDLWLHLDGFPGEAIDKDIESVLCAIRFNTNGLLFEKLKLAIPKAPVEAPKDLLDFGAAAASYDSCAALPKTTPR